MGSEKGLFLLDTGLAAAVVDREIAKSCNFDQRGQDFFVGFGSSQRVPVFRLPPLQLGDATFTTPVFHGVDLRGLSAGRGRRLAGVLGSSFFGGAAVTLDYAAGRLRLEANDGFVAPDDATTLPLEIGIGQPEIKGRLDGGSELRFMLDTGAEAPLILNAPFVQRHELLRDVERLSKASVIAFHGAVPYHIASFAELALGTIAVADVATVLSAPAEGVGLANDGRRAGIVGSAMLAGRRVTFDYRRRQVHIGARAADAQEDGAPSGISFDWDDTQHVRIAAILDWPGRPEIDLKTGDELAAVDGKPLPESPGAMRRLLRERAKVTLTLRRQGETHDVVWERLPPPPRVSLPAK